MTESGNETICFSSMECSLPLMRLIAFGQEPVKLLREGRKETREHFCSHVLSTILPPGSNGLETGQSELLLCSFQYSAQIKSRLGCVVVRASTCQPGWYNQGFLLSRTAN